MEPAAFKIVNVPAVRGPAQGAPGDVDPAQRSAGYLASDATLEEPGAAPTITASRAKVTQAITPMGSALKPPRYTVSGYASFYDNGTTAMRLPQGTIVRICGSAGCIERTVTDYGPITQIRVVDMYRPDFFQICGCASWSGTTWVTVSIY